MLILGGLLIGLSLILWGIGANDAMPTPSGWDAAIDNERRNSRSRYRF
jgi:hypothetical protein